MGGASVRFFFFFLFFNNAIIIVKPSTEFSLFRVIGCGLFFALAFRFATTANEPPRVVGTSFSYARPRFGSENNYTYRTIVVARRVFFSVFFLLIWFVNHASSSSSSSSSFQGRISIIPFIVESYDVWDGGRLLPASAAGSVAARFRGAR